MDKNLQQQLKKRLEQAKAEIEKELQLITKKDPKMEGDYDTKFPDIGTLQSSDESAMRFAEYERTLPIEHILELRLQSINQALAKIKNGTYGLCEKCGKSIDEKRLQAFMDVKTCVGCKTPEQSRKRK